MAPIRVLLVDDEKDFREITSRTLSRRGFEVDAVDGGPSALEYLHAQRPDVIVLDLKMEEMDGIAALRRIRSEHGLIPVIILTGHGSFDSALAGIKLEIVDFLQKPVDIDRLAERITVLQNQPRVAVLSEPLVKDMMVPPDTYPSIQLEESIGELLGRIEERLLANDISGEETRRSMIVRDENGVFVGMVEIADILSLIVPDYLLNSAYRSFFTGMFLAQCKILGEQLVGDVLDFEAEPVISIDTQTPLMEAAVLMADHHLEELPVIEDGKLVGLIRDVDVLRQMHKLVLGRE
jgi:DNA-binding response OmpR family regulator